jgi:hypothetical protein
MAGKEKSKIKGQTRSANFVFALRILRKENIKSKLSGRGKWKKKRKMGISQI